MTEELADATSAEPDAPGAGAVERKSAPRRTYMLVLLLAALSVSYADRSVINVLVPSIKAEFQLADWQLGLLGGAAFALLYSAAALPLAKLADRVNRINILSIAIAVWSVMTTLSGAATSFVQMLLIRAGVGVGEAAGHPLSQSLIADVYEPRKRATALAIYSSGTAIGTFLGLMIGGWITQWYGWRAAFFVLGLPGLLLAVLIKLTVREPRRGLSEHLKDSDARSTVMEVLRLVRTRPTFIHVVAGNAVAAIGAFGEALWLPSFLVRSHGMSVGQVGTLLGGAFLVAGLISQIGGARLADLLGRNDARRSLAAPALIITIGLPVHMAAFLVGPTWLAVLLLFFGHVAASPYPGPVYSAIQGVVGLRQRAVAAAILLVVVNFIGMGLGPLLVGGLSDALKSALGSDSLRVALILIAVTRLWAGLHFYLASRSLVRDVARRPA